MGISIQSIKKIKSYQQKKIRQEENIFVAETPKVLEMLATSSLMPKAIYGTENFLEDFLLAYPNLSTLAESVSEKELERISGLSQAQEVVSLWHIPKVQLLAQEAFTGISLVLDQIQDPGNMGTIIRLADWFGLDRLICSLQTTDAFQPKCVQSSMGAVAHIPIYYTNLLDMAALAPLDFPFYGTFLDGDNLFKSQLQTANAWYIIGNEAHGIQKENETFIRHKLYIPTFSPLSDPTRPHGTESLNVSVAAGILCAQIRSSQ